ncbi:MAG: SDR family NAD(P)-dependent oxidoreductase, partial [Planctomycetaceae bacterium]
MGRLVGRVAVVTGGADGIGKATCVRFAREGAKVVVADINTDLGPRTVAEIQATGGDALFVETDVAQEASIERMVATTVAAYGR